jgi:hypothetical protein
LTFLNIDYSKLLKKGSIGVQTQNYLITGGSPRISSSSAVLQAQSIRNSSLNIKAIEASPNPVNYPFVLMDPKYLDKRLGPLKQDRSSPIISTPNQRSFYTPPPPPPSLSTSSTSSQHLPSLSSTLATNNNAKFVNINQSQKLSLPSLNELKRNISDNHNNNNSNKSNNNENNINNNSNSITPLRIHHWKQNE